MKGVTKLKIVFPEITLLTVKGYKQKGEELFPTLGKSSSAHGQISQKDKRKTEEVTSIKKTG